jgi:hypothetical protein
MSNGDQPPEVPPVTTPDLKTTAKDAAVGISQSGIVEDALVAFFASLIDGLKIVLTIIADLFDDIAALLTEFFTAAQGQDTPGFNRLVAAVLSDTLGVEVSAEQLQQAQFESGRVGAMKQVGADLFNTLANEFVTGTADSAAGAGVGGLPDTGGKPLTPEQGIAAAQSFIGFALSFAVRQGNVAFLSSALPWEWLSGIREYGEMMAKNLGLGRLVRRALQPYIQTLIATPLQQALNKQYRPHMLDLKQLASAYIRGDFDRTEYGNRLALLGVTDTDQNILIADTYTRLPARELLLLHETGFLSDTDLNTGLQHLGFNTADLPNLIQARQLEMLQGVQRGFVDTALSDVQHGRIDLSTFNGDVDATNLPKQVKDWYKIRGANRAANHTRQLSLGFLKKAYFNASITLDEYVAHALLLGFSQDDVDILEQELLVEQKQAADKIKAKAAKIAAKTPKGSGTPPPTTGP